MKYVQVCNWEGRPIEFPTFNKTTPAATGKFKTIKGAITALNTLNSDNTYLLYLKCDRPGYNGSNITFNEFVIIPPGMCIEFRSVKATIRAVEIQKDSSIITGEHVQIRTLINGVKEALVNGCRIDYEEQIPTRSLELEKLHKSLYYPLLAARFTKAYIRNVQHYMLPLFSLLRCTRRVTSNFQILLTLFYLEDYFRIVGTKISELTCIVSNEELDNDFRMIEGEPYFQKQLDSIISSKKEMFQVHLETEDFKRKLRAANHPSVAGDAAGYRDFLLRFLDVVGENVWVQRQMLNLLMNIDVVAANPLMVHLKQINDLLVEAELLVNQLVYHVHRTEDPTVLEAGENSSELVLNIAAAGLQDSNAVVFKKGLVAFLNEKAGAKIRDDLTIGNDSLIACLRDYMSDCPDADYFFTRFIKNHPDVVTGFGLACTGLGTMGTLTSTGISIARFAMKPMAW